MDYKYERIGGKEAIVDSVENVAKEGATTVASDVALKGAGRNSPSLW